MNCGTAASPDTTDIREISNSKRRLMSWDLGRATNILFVP